MFRTILGSLFLLCACGADAPLASKSVSSSAEITIDDGDGGSETSTDILGIVVTPDEVVLPVGSSLQLEALGLNDARESMKLTDAVEWSSSAPSVVSVSNGLSEEGVLQGLAAGTATIVATFEGIESAPSRIKVTSANLERLIINQSSIVLEVGKTVQLSAEATFSDGTSSNASSQVRWITGDGTIVQFDDDGLLEGVGLGSTHVRVEWEGLSSEAIPVEVVNEVESADGDLYFDWVSGIVSDGIFEVSVSIHNASDAAVSGIWLDLFVDPDFVPAYGDWPDWYHMVDYIGANESASVTFTASTSASRHDFAVLVDSTEEVPETDESNNLVIASTDDESGGGSSGGSGTPNLTITYVGGFSEGEQTEYWIDVKNDGDAVAEKFYVDIWPGRAFSDEPELYEDGEAYAFFDEGLAAGEELLVELVIDEACDFCEAWAMVDGYDMVSESNESDNTMFLHSEGI